MYAASLSQPQGLSVGAIARTASGAYLMHRQADGVHRMITGTMEPGESPVCCLLRELREEAGAAGAVVGYAGATLRDLDDQRGRWVKCTLWHVVDVSGFDLAARADDLDCDVVEVAPADIGSVAFAPDRWPDWAMLSN